MVLAAADFYHEFLAFGLGKDGPDDVPAPLPLLRDVIAHGNESATAREQRLAGGAGPDADAGTAGRVVGVRCADLLVGVRCADRLVGVQPPSACAAV